MRYFKKPKDKFKVGNTDKIIEYDSRSYDIESFEERFIECDSDGNEIKPKPKAKPKSSKKESK